MTRECLLCTWRRWDDRNKRFGSMCTNPKSLYYNGEIPDNPAFTMCEEFELRETKK